MHQYPYAYTEHVIGMRIMSPFSQICISIVNMETITVFFWFCFLNLNFYEFAFSIARTRNFFAIFSWKRCYVNTPIES